MTSIFLPPIEEAIAVIASPDNPVGSFLGYASSHAIGARVMVAGAPCTVIGEGDISCGVSRAAVLADDGRVGYASPGHVRWVCDSPECVCTYCWYAVWTRQAVRLRRYYYDFRTCLPREDTADAR